MTTAAVIGCGDVSVVHLAAIERLGIKLVGVCDVEPARAGNGYLNHRDLLDDLRPDVVHICTPHDQHVPVAIDALERGIHVLLEKPVAHTVADADRLIAAAKDHPEVKVGVCLQNRYNPTTQAARTLLASGGLGTVRGGSATVLWQRDPSYYRARPWRGRIARSGGGVLINQAIHTLDLLEWLLGDVVGLRGHAGRYGFGAEIDVEDTAHLLLDHAGGARSVLFATVTNVVDAPVTIEIVTERATLLIRGDLTVSYQDGRVEVIAERRAGPGGRAYWGASHELLIADFYRQLTEPEPFWLGLDEGVKSLRLIDQVYRQHT
ncbi:Gfo/Idh/MocA family oxidoreductase [Micromonospora sp. WMMD812]|uniref:Gfo/Idh/MocA family protein n=1 Tax=Micromonospora sp. WMMD812 TaxID=3015152 RepID=UPI00248AD493|nr:Gfo/Idh/MocA family oxidoreductase [Micromonospora sp. WMMD812]WBB67711.1 Gfo/Idh/MocA family oxidoreductase [Micromonospora sp. WMMD812]